MRKYDYIFAGTGLAALMTVYEMILSKKFTSKKILLLDSDAKKTNDRTWCFWEKPNGTYENLVSKKWNTAIFSNEIYSRDLDLNPYQYKMIQGLDFYNFIFEVISKQENIEFSNQKVISFQEENNQVSVKTETEHFTCQKLFNSIFNPKEVLSQDKYPLLQQHFIGWKIKSAESVFTAEKATFMDFSVAQKGNTRFMYVLPFSETEALLEYTLFSKDLLSEKEYEDEIKNYIEKLGIKNYEIIEKEKGNIPMTSYPFWNKNSKNIINIGSAGGWTKASTGYTFKNASKKSKALVSFLLQENDFRKFYKRDKFWFYDLLLLDILDKKNHVGSSIFSAMFKKGNPSLIFKFLDEETTFYEDTQVILKCPTGLFLKALFDRIIR
ncbi:lycopene cyclase family protein [Flavobacterium qiangtangense]|uniref:Lycopene cyclase family protein n=1 Tax=Flavobacterium qiangtangense TaxID=1442595 RepID=A0ABW1PPD3_9FLAO